jgi:hypothetical protein
MTWRNATIGQKKNSSLIPEGRHGAARLGWMDRYGISTQHWGAWTVDQLRGLGIALALANVNHSMWRLRAQRQIHVGPFQRKEFTVRAHPGIYRQSRRIADIIGSLRQVQRFLREIEHASATLGLGQFVNGGCVLQPTPFNGEMENAPQRA